MKNQFLRCVTIFYILLPSYFFLYGWLKPPFAILSIVVLIGFSLSMLLDSRAALSNWRPKFATEVKQSFSLVLASCLVGLFVVIWVAFSGAGGVGYQNSDYRANNALLKELVIQDWPPEFAVSGTTLHLAYYVAYFLPAAAVGKIFGWVCANIFLFIWTLTGVLLAFAWFWNLSKVQLKNDVSKLWIIAAIFCLAGGLDYFGYYVMNNHAFALGTQIESWAEYFQYSSNTTLLYWVPQHTIAAWLITGMVTDALYNKHNLQYLGMSIAGGILWSPFGLIGMAPYLLLILIVYLQPQHRNYLLNKKSILFNSLSIGFACVFLIYLGSNQFKFPIGLVWQSSKDRTSMVENLLNFWFLEFAFLACLILLFIVFGVTFARSTQTGLSWQKRMMLLEHEFRVTPVQFCLFLVSLCILWLLPYFKMGINNDLVMRGSIPSLFIFWAFVAKVIVDVSFRVRMKFNLLYVFIWMTVIIGFFPAMTAIVNSARAYHLGPPPFAGVPPLIESTKTEHVLQRMGSDDTFFFHYLGK